MSWEINYRKNQIEYEGEEYRLGHMGKYILSVSCRDCLYYSDCKLEFITHVNEIKINYEKQICGGFEPQVPYPTERTPEGVLV